MKGSIVFGATRIDAEIHIEYSAEQVYTTAYRQWTGWADIEEPTARTMGDLGNIRIELEDGRAVTAEVTSVGTSGVHFELKEPLPHLTN